MSRLLSPACEFPCGRTALKQERHRLAVVKLDSPVQRRVQVAVAAVGIAVLLAVQSDASSPLALLRPPRASKLLSLQSHKLKATRRAAGALPSAQRARLTRPVLLRKVCLDFLG